MPSKTNPQTARSTSADMASGTRRPGAYGMRNKLRGICSELTEVQDELNDLKVEMKGNQEIEKAALYVDWTKEAVESLLVVFEAAV